MINKTKNTLPSIIYKKPTKKDILNAVLLIFCYFFFDIGISLVTQNNNQYYLYSIIFFISLFIVEFRVFKDELINSFIIFKDNIKKYLKFIFKNIFIAYGFELIAVIIQIIVVGETSSVNQDLLKTLNPFFLAISAALFAPFIEEILFRGCIRRFIKNDLLFIIVSGIIFGFLHVISEPTMIRFIFVSIPYISLGCMLAYSYVKSNNILTNILMHFFINLIALIAMFFIK